MEWRASVLVPVLRWRQAPGPHLGRPRPWPPTLSATVAALLLKRWRLVRSSCGQTVWAWPATRQETLACRSRPPEIGLTAIPAAVSAVWVSTTGNRVQLPLSCQCWWWPVAAAVTPAMAAGRCDSGVPVRPSATVVRRLLTVPVPWATVLRSSAVRRRCPAR